MYCFIEFTSYICIRTFQSPFTLVRHWIIVSSIVVVGIGVDLSSVLVSEECARLFLVSLPYRASTWAWLFSKPCFCCRPRH